MSMAAGIHHVAPKCGNSEEFEKVTGFYEDLLGPALLHRWGEGPGACAMLGAGRGIAENFASGRSVCRDRSKGSLWLRKDGDLT